jgi:hypothetical protein
MKIVNFIIALKIVCCGIALPASANLANSTEYEQLVAEVSNLSNSGLTPILRQLAIHFVEKNIKKLIKSTEKQISRSLERIEDRQQFMRDYDAGNYDLDEYYWLEEEYKKSPVKIAKYQEQIVEWQEDLRLYNDLLSQVQSLKS